MPKIKPKDEETTMFRELIDNDMPAEDKTPQRLSDEASRVLGASGEKTAETLMRTFYQVLESPDVVKVLRDEVKSRNARAKRNAVPGNPAVPPLPECGGGRRSPGVIRYRALQYADWTSKPGKLERSIWL